MSRPPPHRYVFLAYVSAAVSPQARTQPHLQKHLLPSPLVSASAHLLRSFHKITISYLIWCSLPDAPPGTGHVRCPTEAPPARRKVQEDGAVRGVAVDGAGARIYWTAVVRGRGEGRGEVRSADGDGRRRVTMWSERGAEPDDIVVCVETG
ncbi:unnamed protein product [Leptidea sinapis]|uniref:Uncharacterized protein n=1 Tax=Leptidea sinapis TaxID=189913 RepID=A0A5E4PYY8_9NEOP|nr:unnamed protein product [Leptidea sinapis]